MTLNKSIYVGCTVLELSKLEMYKFHYDFLKKKCKKYVLLFTDTDSLFYEVDEDFYEIMHQHKELFNLNNFLKNNKYFCNDNKKVLGKMQDEYGGTPIYQFIGLRSKIFSIRDVNKKGKSTHHIKDITHILVMVNIMIHSLIKKFLDIKWQESNLENINYLHTKIMKHLHLFLMINVIFLLME